MLVTSEKVENIINRLDKKKEPSHDLVTGDIIKNLPSKDVLISTHLINAVIRLKHFPNLCKAAKIILIEQPGKSSDEVFAYEPFLSKTMQNIMESKN